jgi:diacylglycerol kinase
MDHFFLLIWHALLISVFFAFLWRVDKKERIILFLKTFLIMVVGGVLVGWLMYPFP